MYTTVHGIALRTVRYNDTSSILTAWTAEHGRLSLLMPAAGSRESRRRRALTMPFSLFCCQVDLRPDRHIFSVRDMRPEVVAADITANPVKATVAIFLADALDSLLRMDALGDPALWALLRNAVTALDRVRRPAAIANFHLWFLYRLGAVMGIEPDVTDYRPGYIFDLVGASYRPSAPGHSHYVEAAEAAMPYVLSRLQPRTLHRLRLTAAQRNRALDTIIQYYTLHNMPLGNLQSLAVLRSMV